MKIDAGRLRDEPEISLTSLIDVVFTLIIFFVVTTTFDARSALKVNLPNASPQALPEQSEPLIISVDASGRYFVDSEEVLNSDARSLRETISRVAGSDRKRPIVLRADAKAQHQSVVTVMDVLGRLGFERLSIATVAESAE